MTNTGLANFTDGISVDKSSGVVLENVDGEEMILARRGNEFFAVAATCAHSAHPFLPN